MQTHFSPEQLATPDLAEANAILRSCVHCGFCLPACPTYQLTGDENDSPRGRIYLIKDMFETGATPDGLAVRHIDRCLGCLACMPACPSGVDYMRLVDLGRQHIEKSGPRPMASRFMRRALAHVVSREPLFRAFLAVGRSIGRVMPRLPGRLGYSLRAARQIRRVPAAAQLPAHVPASAPAQGKAHRRVLLLPGCVQQALHPEVNRAAIRLLTRHGVDVVVARRAGCCGALDYHLGQVGPARGHAERVLSDWNAARKDGKIDAVINMASGCGSFLKEYGRMLASDPARSGAAEEFASSVRDISEVMTEIGLKPSTLEARPIVAYQSPCSLEHGQRAGALPRGLLRQAGFDLRELADANTCCGSAGSYSLLQPELSQRLRQRKLRSIASSGAELVATANVGCQVHLESGCEIPVYHVAQLLDWATGGPPIDDRPTG